MHYVSREFTFEAAHRIVGHRGRCKNVHGHSYTAIVEYASAELDDLAMVLDYGDIKNTIGEWIDKNLDHSLILHKEDPLAKWIDHARSDLFASKTLDFLMFGERVYLMDSPPTAEALAKLIFEVAERLLGDNSRAVVNLVTVKETAKTSAHYMNERAR